MKEKYYGAISLIVGAFTYATFPVFIRSLNLSFGEFTQVAIRCFIAVMLLIILIFRKRLKLYIAPEKRKSVALFAVSFPLAIFLFTFSALQTKIANTVFALYIGSLIVSFIVGVFVFKEKVTLKKIISLIFVVIGLGFFTYPFNIVGASGIFLGLLAGIFDGITNSLRKYITDIPRNVVLFYQYSVGVVLSILMILLFKEEVVNDSMKLQSILAGIVFGALLVLIGNVTIYGFQKFDLNLGTIIISSELVFSLILGLIFFSETPSIQESIGAVLIVFAVIVANIEFQKKTK